MDTKIVEYLTEIGDFVPTLEIAKGLYGPTASKKMINPTLYKLERQGIIEKTALENGAQPRWKIKEPSQI